MASLSAVRSTTIAFTTSRDPTKGGSLRRQRCMDCAGAVACCAKNGSNAGETDRSLIALGNPACPNNFAKRPAGEREAALPNRPGGLDAAIQRSGGMPDLLLHIGQYLTVLASYQRRFSPSVSPAKRN